MIDRAIGIVGLALALLAVVFQYQFKTVPNWAILLLLAISFLLIGASIGLIMAGGLRQKRRLPGPANLRLHVYGDHRVPECISSDNIFRWYMLWMDVNIIGPDGVTQTVSQNILFVSFENDVAITTFRVQSPNAALPQHEVKDFNQRYAIVVFSQRVPACTLDISATQ